MEVLSSQKTTTILVVDDNFNNLKVLIGTLSKMGWEILTATDGKSALEQAGYAQPDLILLDVMMPGMNGFQTCQCLKENSLTKEIPVIFMTALSETVDKVKGFSLGGIDYITKPFEYEELVVRIQNQLRMRHLALQVQQQNKELELRVAERTYQLTQSLQNLQQAQTSLIQQEKMSSLGEMIAGIAHEINNPLGFISSNLVHASESTQALIEILKLYQQAYPNPIPEILEQMEAIDLDYLLGDLPTMLASMKKGTHRIKEIIYSLRHFSRRDETTQTVNIHEGLESTLMILQHRLKAHDRYPQIKVIKEYGNLPPVNCFPGPMNQVFMNILANAIDAIHEAIDQGQKRDYSPTILIQTEFLSSDTIGIRIRDNGPGISETVMEKLFEPMFTTKPVGKGTGMGLSISRQIIENKHGGSLQLNSSLGQGAEFRIEIPIHVKF
jgi:signal transduction histidine kinase